MPPCDALVPASAASGVGFHRAVDLPNLPQSILKGLRSLAGGLSNHEIRHKQIGLTLRCAVSIALLPVAVVDSSKPVLRLAFVAQTLPLFDHQFLRQLQ